jgi:hypothetical protein
MNPQEMDPRFCESSAKLGVRPPSSVMLNLFQHPMVVKTNDMDHA